MGKRRSSSRSGSKRVKIVVDSNDSTESSRPPFIVSFPCNSLPADEQAVSFTLHQPQEVKRKRQRVIVGADEKVDYWGTNYGPMGKEELDHTQYYVGVLDKETGQMTVYPSGHAYSLRQSIKGVESQVEDFALAGVSLQDRRASLIESFGSKKKQAAVRSARSNIIDANRVVGGEDMSKALAQVLQGSTNGVSGVGEEAGTPSAGEKVKVDAATDAFEAARRTFLPPFHANATSPEEAYDLLEIMGHDMLSAIEREVEEGVAAQDGDVNTYLREYINGANDGKGNAPLPKFVRRELLELTNVNEGSQRLRMLKLIYLRLLFNFNNATAVIANTVTAIATSYSLPEVVARRFLEVFAVCEKRNNKGGKNTYVRTKALKDKLQVYILCVALMLSGCKMEYVTLAQELKLSKNQASTLLRSLGATTGSTTAVLKVPLTFPKRKMALAKKN